MLKRLSKRAFALLALSLALNVASCRTRDSTDASSRLQATTPAVPSYGDDFKIYYHWGEAAFLDRLTKAHIPNHLFPGGEKDYGYYSDDLFAQVMEYSRNSGNIVGSGLYVADNPISSIEFANDKKHFRLIEVIIDNRIAAGGTLQNLGILQSFFTGWYVVKKNMGVYFREFSGAGLSANDLLKYKKKILQTYTTEVNFRPWENARFRYFLAKADAILENPPQEKVRLLPPPEWVYGKDYRVYYHWGDAETLDRFTNTHIPNHIYPGEEKAYGYYSDDLYAEVMQSANVPKNAAGPGLYVSLNPITAIDDIPYGNHPKLIEVIVDNRVVDDGTMQTLGKDARSDLRVLKKNKGIYFREFSGTGFSRAQLLDIKEMLFQWNGLKPGAIPTDPKSAPVRYLSDRVDVIIKNQPKDKVRLLPPREWVCPSG